MNHTRENGLAVFLVRIIRQPNIRPLLILNLLAFRLVQTSAVLPLIFSVGVGQALSYDLLLKGGHLIDPKNQIDAQRDVAITGGRIAAVAPEIPVGRAKSVIDVTGLYVAPGFIDIHVHVFENDRGGHIWADTHTLRAGVTMAVDAGSAGWRTFPAAQREVIKRAQTRVLAFLNIAAGGIGRSENKIDDLDPEAAAKFIEQHRDVIVGIKTAHWASATWDSVERALEAGRLADLPVMVDFGHFLPRRPFEELVGKRLRPGDIYTHLYIPAVPMLDQQGRLRPYLLEAQRRGVIFDAGHGQGSFSYRQAVPATRDGFWPNTISTDIHKGNINRGMKDMANVMSKFLNLGLSLPEVIARSTWAPARAIRRPEYGHLTVGAGADIAVFKVLNGDFGFYDVLGGMEKGSQKIECELTLRDGAVVWDLNARSMSRWQDLPPNAPTK